MMTGGIRMEESREENILFGRNSWLSYLPEIYDTGEDSFLSRYLSVFQSLYEEMTQKISSLPHRLYPEYAERETLEWLAECFGLENTELWDDRQLAYLLLHQNRLSEVRGTRAYMEEMLRLFTREIPFIVEYYQILPYQTSSRRAELLEMLYGSNPYEVSVIIRQQAVRGQQETAILHRIIEASVPAGIECRLVVLQSCIYLDQYSYIGINSRLAGYEQVRLDNGKLLPYRSVMGGDR